MYEQTQTHQSSGMGGMPSGYDGEMDGGQSDQASASRRLRVRVAGTALFTVGIAALGYSMVDRSMDPDNSSAESDSKSNGNNLVVPDHVKEELSSEFLNPKLDYTPIKTTSPGPKIPEKPPVEKTHEGSVSPALHDHSLIGPNGLHDFSTCGGFSKAFAHARAELGGPGEIFIFHGKPYTTTYKHEVEDGGHVASKHGFEVEMVVKQNADGSIIVAADTDKDGVADKWYYENNHVRCQLIDTNGDKTMDSFSNQHGEIVKLETPITPEPVSIPKPSHNVVTMDGVEFIAYGEPGKYNSLMGEYDGKLLSYRDTDGDGKLDHAAFLDVHFKPIHEWEITPMKIEDGDIIIPDGMDEDPVLPGRDDDKGSTSTSSTYNHAGSDEDDATSANNGMAEIEEDLYRSDVENELNSGDLNNQADMSDYSI